jgi:hypothetical protein
MNLDEPFLVIGSGSSGTHLLGVLLDKHPKLACGPELGVFNKKPVYRNFERVVASLDEYLEHGLGTDTYASYRPFFRSLDAYFWTRHDLLEMAQTVEGPREFFDRFYAAYLKNRQKCIWGEKTLSNVYCVEDFLEVYPRARLLHLVRDGRDVLCSKIRRGATAYDASCQWFMDVSTALAYRDRDAYLELKYEDLVREPDVVLREVCEHLNVEYSEKMLSPASNKYWESLSDEYHESWSHPPSAATISDASVGRYQQDLDKNGEQLFWRVRSTLFGRRGGAGHRGTGELMEDLEYVDSAPITPFYLSAETLVAAADWVRGNVGRLRRGEKPILPQTYIA